jgi:GxxExxY protein
MDGLDKLTEKIIGCAIEVHGVLGPGLWESTYESAMCIELADAGMNFPQQLAIPAVYKGRIVGEYRLDLIIEDSVVVEQKVLSGSTPFLKRRY